MDKPEYILETQNIRKFYGSVTALNNISLQFADKKIYGLFGRNGAGKTTLLNIISSRIFPDQGHTLCFGKDIRQHPEALAENCCYMPEKHYFPARFTVKRLLSHAQGSFLNYSEVYADRLCRDFNLDTDREYGQLSSGHQSVFRIVLGLAAKAPITVFDEPVMGLDAAARDRFYSELIEEYSRDPRLFLISTHMIDESADLFNEAIIIKHGRIIRQASVEDLLSNAFYVSGTSQKVDEFLKTHSAISSKTVGSLKTAVVDGTINTADRMPGLNFSPLTIQNLFIHLTGEESERSEING